MVNLDKWEKIECTDLKIGDKIRRINKHDDGTVADIKGTIKSVSFGVFRSKNSFALVRPTYAYPVELYRRKPKPFVFPTTPLTIIEGTPCNTAGGTRRYMRTEAGSWRSTDSGGLAFEEALRSNFKDWKVIYEGIEL
jgi:hypothetical protein